MSKYRKDYIFDEYVIISDNRAGRPNDFIKEEKESTDPEYDEKCFFCPSREHTTPPEIDRVNYKNDNKNWMIRVFPNKFPAVTYDEKIKEEKKKKYLIEKTAFGYHEIVVENPRHNITMSELTFYNLLSLIEMYSKRISVLRKKKNVKYVSLFKNVGEKAGASLKHTHTQLIAYNQAPKRILEGEKASMTKCPFCEIIEIEKKSERFCFENESFIAFTPFASKFAFELRLFPKRHIVKLEDLTEKEEKDMTKILKIIFKKINRLQVDYNFYLNYGIKNMHFHLVFTPRMNNFAGFEVATETIINPVSPENAAIFYQN